MLNILIAEDHAIVRKGLEQIINDHYPDAVTDSAETGETALAKVRERHYDLVILDLSLPGANSIGLFNQLLQEDPTLRILICTMSPEKIFAFRYLRLGAAGYVKQSSPNEVLLEAIQTVLKGRTYCSNEVTDLMAERFSGRLPSNRFDMLSDKEFEVSLHILKGLQNTEIAELLDVHQSTIAARKVRIFKKVGVANMVELYNLARANGMID